MQQELRLLGVIDSAPRIIDWELIKLCKTEQQAMRLCKDKSYAKYTDDDIAEELGMKRASLNTILNSDRNGRPRYMSRVQQIRLQRFCGNKALDQWAELFEKGLLNCQKSEKQIKVEALKQEFETKLRALEG